jgi:hypothetical protein
MRSMMEEQIATLRLMNHFSQGGAREMCSTSKRTVRACRRSTIDYADDVCRGCRPAAGGRRRGS